MTPFVKFTNRPNYLCPYYLVFVIQNFVSLRFEMSHLPPYDISNEAFIAKLKANNLKATPQRIAVHEAMMELGHANATQVSEYIESKGEAKITLASIYNILCQLALLGIYSYRHSVSNKMYFDVNTCPHVHLYDRKSDNFIDVNDEELCGILDSYIKKKRFKGYRVEGYDLNILCRPSGRKLSNKK